MNPEHGWKPECHILQEQLHELKAVNAQLTAKLEHLEHELAAFNTTATNALAGNDSKAEGIPTRPPCVASPHEVTTEMRDRQRNSPEQWTMTFREWNVIVDYCKDLPEYHAIKKQKRFVSMYDLCDRFVKPWTRGTGCSLAVLASKGRREIAKLMLSHVSLACQDSLHHSLIAPLQAWAESVEECQEALTFFFNKYGIDPDTPIWFCVFGMSHTVVSGTMPNYSPHACINQAHFLLSCVW